MCQAPGSITRQSLHKRSRDLYKLFLFLKKDNLSKSSPHEQIHCSELQSCSIVTQRKAQQDQRGVNNMFSCNSVKEFNHGLETHRPQYFNRII